MSELTDLQLVVLVAAGVVLVPRLIGELLRPLWILAVMALVRASAAEQAGQQKRAAKAAYEEAGRRALAELDREQQR